MVLVAAVADNGVIAHRGTIPWRIPEDLRHFRAVTRDHAVLMGRTTYEEMAAPLPYRTNIVLTRDPDWSAEGVLVAHDLDEALTVAAGCEHAGRPLMVIGGAQVYALALAHGAEEQVLTEVHASPEGDTYYPVLDPGEWRERRREPHLEADVPFELVWWERRTAPAS